MTPHILDTGTLAGRSVAVLALFVLPALQGWTPYLGEPPADVSPHECFASWTLAIPRDGVVSIVGRADCDLHGKAIQIRWLHKATGTWRYQRIATSFWPTTMSVLGDKKTLIIGGKREGGNTVIEAWTFAASEIVIPEDGYPAIREAERSVRTLYDAAVQSRDMVTHVIAKQGADNAFLARFWDSGNVEEFRCADGPSDHHIVASPTAGLSGLLVPPLSQKVGDAWSAEHVTRGYVYVFSAHCERLESLVLIDANKDGTLDSWIDVTPDAWCSGDWGDASNYVFLPRH